MVCNDIDPKLKAVSYKWSPPENYHGWRNWSGNPYAYRCPRCFKWFKHVFTSNRSRDAAAYMGAGGGKDPNPDEVCTCR
jgi:hypothetical protein